MIQKQSFPYLDIAKLIMAFLVVEMHTRPLNDIGSGVTGQIVSVIDCVAVPFFFIVLSFLCFRRALASHDFKEWSSLGVTRVLGTIRKQLLLYAIWTALLLPLAVFGAFLRGWSAGEALVRFVRGVVFVGE